jgi:chromosome segregation ATPase
MALFIVNFLFFIVTVQRSISELRSKLSQAEHSIDQLQEEKRDAIRQMHDMQEEFEEMQDSFREEQAEEFASLKKELDDATKNCRLLQFKLRKVEKRGDQLEAEKKELEQRLETTSNSGKLARLEDELRKTKNENEKLKSKDTLGVSGLKKKSPVLTKAPSGEVKPITNYVGSFINFKKIIESRTSDAT